MQFSWGVCSIRSSTLLAFKENAGFMSGLNCCRFLSHALLWSLVSDGLEKRQRWGPVQRTWWSWRVRLHLHQPYSWEGGAGRGIEAYMRREAFHVFSEAGGEGGRPCGETYQQPNQPVNWQRLASSISDTSSCWQSRSGSFLAVSDSIVQNCIFLSPWRRRGDFVLHLVFSGLAPLSWIPEHKSNVRTALLFIPAREPASTTAVAS